MQENTISGGGVLNKTQNIDCPLSRTVGKLLPNTRSGFHGASDWLLKLSESQLPENWRCCLYVPHWGLIKLKWEKMLTAVFGKFKAFNQCGFPWLTFALTHPYGWAVFPRQRKGVYGAYASLLPQTLQTISKKTFNRAPGAWTSRKLNWLQSTILQRTHSGPGGEHCLRSQGWRQRWDADTGLTTPALPQADSSVRDQNKQQFTVHNQ